MKKILMLGAALLAFQAVPALAEHHEGKGDKGAKMFEKQDTNKDGTISEAEFMANAKERFTAMDGNKDGKVTKEEAKAHYDAKKAEWKAKREQMKKDAPAEKPAE